MRYFAKLAIQPALMQLINIVAFDASVQDRLGIVINIYIIPETGFFLQLVLGPCLVLFET